VRQGFDASKVIVEVIIPANTTDPVLAAFVFSRKKATDVVFDVPTLEFRSQVIITNSQLQASLPTYMVPSIYVPLSQVPLTVSGKTDRRRLRELAAKLTREELENYSTVQTSIIGPRTDRERTLHVLFARILSLAPKSVSIYGEWIRLGGDSIKSMQLAIESRKEGINLTVQDIFQEKTISRLAQKSFQNFGSFIEATLPPHNPALETLLSRKFPLTGVSYPIDVEYICPCSPMQQGMLISQAKSTENYQIRFVWKVIAKSSQPISIEKLQRAWRLVVESCPMLRTVFIESTLHSTGFIQVALKAGSCSNMDAVILNEKQPFPPKTTNSRGKDSLPRLVLYKSNNSELHCMLSISHMLIDATSITILLENLKLSYDGQYVGNCQNIAHYRDYVSYLQQNSNGLEYWKRYLSGCTPCIFPHLCLDQSTPSTRPEFRSIDVSLEKSFEFHRFCRENGTTLSNVFHVAWGLVLRTFTGQENISFGYLKSTRDAPIRGDIERAIGPFISMLICRMNINMDSTIFELLEQTQIDLLNGLLHENFSLAESFHSSMTSGTMFNTSISYPPDRSREVSTESSILFLEVERHDPTEVSKGSIIQSYLCNPEEF
jgi:aryl carrier-like protein